MADPIALSWLVGLALFPWPVAYIVQRYAGVGRHEAGLVAYNLAAITPNIALTYIGVHLWFFDANLAAAYSAGHRERLYTPLSGSASMLSVCMGYEAWNTLAALVIPEYRTAAFVGHHATTLYLVLLARAPFVHVYVAFFIGVASASSVLLGFVDIFRHVGALQRALPLTNTCLRVAFALTFLATRSALWLHISLRFWKDVYTVLAAGTAHSVWACGVYLAANAFLTGLQLFWTWKIVQGLRKAAVGGGGESAKES